MTCEVSIGDYFACEDEPYEGPITTILDGDGDEHESLAGDLVRAIVVDVGGSWAAISMPNGAALRAKH